MLSKENWVDIVNKKEIQQQAEQLQDDYIKAMGALIKVVESK